MKRITMKNPVVEIDGDEMTRIMWKAVKEMLIEPYVLLESEYYDLGLENRDNTDDQVTIEAAEAIRRHRVGVKCATITPNGDRMKEYSLKNQWKSPNGTIRAMLDGTVFRKPIIVSNIKPSVKSWKEPIIVGRHAYGDVYKNSEIRIDGPGTAEIIFRNDKGNEIRREIHNFSGSGLIQGIHNTDTSIRSFAKACFEYALDQNVDVWFSAKDTISKIYDARFKDIFEEEYTHYSNLFEDKGLIYFYSLIDDVVARIMKSEGGVLWACKNYDGDVMSDMVASAFGSLAMMSSVLVSPEGCFEYEAAHGTVQKHYYRHLKGEKTSTNSVALIYAWTGALRKRGELDNNSELISFADKLENSVIWTIEAGIMTGDLAALAEPAPENTVNWIEFIESIADNMEHSVNNA